MKTFCLLASAGVFVAAKKAPVGTTAEIWTPFYSADEHTGMGDIESYQSLSQQHELCGKATGNGGYAKAIAAECRTKGSKLSPAVTGQSVHCDVDGFTCKNADNLSCFGSNAACAAANTKTGNNNNGRSNKQDACQAAAAKGCHWGCYDYEVRFQCTSHNTAVPTTAPTPRPTMVPTSAPTSAPTSFPTPAPSPRGAYAAASIELIPSTNRIEHHDMESCREAFAHTWRKNQNVKVECTSNDDAVHITSQQSSSTPGIITDLYGSHQAAGSDIEANKWYVIIIKGKAVAPAEAYPYMRCADAVGRRKNILWKTGTAAKAQQLGYDDGFSISYVKESVYTKDCEFGALFTKPSVGSKMYIDYTEVRPLEGYEVSDLELEVGTPTTPQAAFPEHQRGRISNAAFKLGTVGWLKNDPATSSLAARGEWAAGDGSQGAVLRETKVPLRGKRNGIVQKSITVVKGQKYKFTVVGKFSGGTNGKASLYVGDSSGSLIKNVVWGDKLLARQGFSEVSAVFTAPSTKIEVGVLSVNAGVGNRIIIKSTDLSVYNPLTDEVHTAHKVGHVNAKQCDCDIAKHPSAVTRCEFTVNPSDPKHHHVLKVTHQKETMGKADYHRCGDVSTTAVPECKCCDCDDGVIHSPGYDINTLKNAKDFMVKFNDFTSNAGDIKPGMTGKCRFDSTSTNHWCCQCTAGNCGKNYGDEVCHAHDETPGHGINFWGRNYEFKSSYHGRPTFQNEHVSQNDQFTVTSIQA